MESRIHNKNIQIDRIVDRIGIRKSIQKWYYRLEIDSEQRVTQLNSLVQ